MLQSKLFFKYLFVIIFASFILFTSSCTKHQDVFYIEGSLWHATWQENGQEVNCTLTFGDENCIIEIFTIDEIFVTNLSYLYNDDHIVFSINNNLEIVDFNQTGFTWYNFPYAESAGYDIDFVHYR